MLRIIEEALTFDDVLLVPGYSKILPHQVDIKTKLTKLINLNMPIISSAMDTVTESRLAISIAQEGGVGIIHKNMSIEDQSEEVKRVKKFENGMITNPLTASKDLKIFQILKIMKKYNFSGIPITENNNLVGLVTLRDIRFVKNLNNTVETVMTKKKDLITVKQGCSKDHIKSILHENRIEKLLVINDIGKLVGLITVKDIEGTLKEKKQNVCKDMFGRLIVGAAVGTTSDTKERVNSLVKSGVDIIVVDTAHGHSKKALSIIEWIKENFADLQVIGGNIATKEAAKSMIDCGADAVKVGIGPGSICTTRVIAGVGIPQLSAISNVYSITKNYGIPIIADGGIRYSGDMCKAIAAGASVVMVGSLFAGTEESPGEVELFQGRSYKSYRGMGSIGAMKQGSSDRYFQDNVDAKKLVPEGIEGRVPYKGKLEALINQLVGGLKAGMGYTGCTSIKEMNKKTKFVKITNAGFRESHIHDVMITKEPPNYQFK